VGLPFTVRLRSVNIAIAFMSNSWFTSPPYWFHVRQPFGGVRARPLLAASAMKEEEEAAAAARSSFGSISQSRG
jgi:hypothetical protein